MFYLYLNLVRDDFYEVFISCDSKIIAYKKRKSSRKEGQQILSVIDDVLLLSKVKISNLNYIAIVQGVGSFTSTRIMVTTVNTFAYILDIPIISINIDNDNFTRNDFVKSVLNASSSNSVVMQVDPFYQSEPNITKSK